MRRRSPWRDARWLDERDVGLIIMDPIIVREEETP